MNSAYKVLVTGGAGFIGSHLVDRLIADGYEVKVVDNLTSGCLENVEQWLNNPNFTFIEGNLNDESVIKEGLRGVELVYHLAANPEVKIGETAPIVHFNENLKTTFNLLEGMRLSERAKTIIFASTSTVYGEASKIPTPEDYGPLIPISTYGASKLGCEALICSYVYTFALRG